MGLTAEAVNARLQAPGQATPPATASRAPADCAYEPGARTVFGTRPNDDRFVAQWEAGVGSVLSGRSVWLSAGGGLTLFVAVDQVV